MDVQIQKIKLGNYRFDGPIGSVEMIEDKPGLFAVYCLKENGYYPIDVDESETIKSSILKHPRIEEWKEQAKAGVITFAVYYTPNLDKEGRKKIEKSIRGGEILIPCGGND